MPTITKPKRPIDPELTPITIPPKRKRNICESAGLHYTSRAGKAFLKKVEHAITWHGNMIKRVPLRSLPAHTIAALRPLATQTAALAMALQPENLPVEVSSELGHDVMTGHAHLYLTHLVATIENAITGLEGQGTQGQQKRLLAQAHEQAMADLEGIFRDFASGTCGDDDRAEFLTHCAKCLKA
jgi:hypothetical protein